MPIAKFSSASIALLPGKAGVAVVRDKPGDVVAIGDGESGEPRARLQATSSVQSSK